MLKPTHCLRLAVILCAVPAAALAQSAPAPLQPAFSPYSVVDAKDRTVPQTPGGVLAGFSERPWWQALAYCAGVYENQADTVEQQGAAAELAQLRQTRQSQFVDPAIQRLMADRGNRPCGCVSAGC